VTKIFYPIYDDPKSSMKDLRKLKIRGSNKRCKGRVEHRVEKTFPKGKIGRCFEKPWNCSL